MQRLPCRSAAAPGEQGALPLSAAPGRSAVRRLARAWRGIADAGGPARAGAVCLLCVVTIAVFVSDIRYQTRRSGLFPGVVTGQWGVSPRGVALLNADPSVVILSALDGPEFPYLVNQIPDPGRLSHVRIRAEMATLGLRAGEADWQRARILFWSYDGAGNRLRYLPHELGALEGTSDWRRLTLVVPIVPEVRLLRLIIYNGGLDGRMFVRGLAVDDVVETRAFRLIRAALVTLWAAVGVWALLPLAGYARRRPLAAATLLTGAAILGGTLAPQPLLSDLLAPVERAAKTIAAPLLQAVNGDAPEIPAAAPADPVRTDEERPGGPIMAEPEEARRLEGARVSFSPDWAPRLEAGAMAHLAAFVALGLLLPLAFPGAGWGALLLYLAVFSVATETVQGFYFSRTPEAGDLAANLAGIPIGFALAFLARRAPLRRRRR